MCLQIILDGIRNYGVMTTYSKMYSETDLKGDRQLERTNDIAKVVLDELLKGTVEGIKKANPSANLSEYYERLEKGVTEYLHGHSVRKGCAGKLAAVVYLAKEGVLECFGTSDEAIAGALVGGLFKYKKSQEMEADRQDRVLTQAESEKVETDVRALLVQMRQKYNKWARLEIEDEVRGRIASKKFT